MPSPQVRTYDAKRIIITIGSHIVSGYAEDTFVSIEPTGDGTQATSGADGEVARSLSNNRLHRITITLQQTSLSNDYLSRAFAMDQASGGAGVLPLQVRDLRGESVFAASQAWITNMPSMEFGSSVAEREWEIDAVATDYHIGGNLA